MRRTIISKGFVASCGLALAVAAGACSNDSRPQDDLGRNSAVTNEGDRADRADNRSATADTADQRRGEMNRDNARGHEGAPITLVGCLQKGDGLNNYILTGVNRPAEAVGTTGDVASKGAAAVEREQVRSAHHAFRVAGKDDEMRDMVGKQVRVVGTVEDGSDLWRETRKGENEHGNLDPNRKDRIDVSESDLAKVDVNSIEQVANVCGEMGAQSGRK
jgi:hypothetical protein